MGKNLNRKSIIKLVDGNGSGKTFFITWEDYEKFLKRLFVPMKNVK